MRCGKSRVYDMGGIRTRQSFAIAAMSEGIDPSIHSEVREHALALVEQRLLGQLERLVRRPACIAQPLRELVVTAKRDLRHIDIATRE